MRARVHGSGLGLRRDYLPALRSGLPGTIDFLELAPEDRLGLGGAWHKDLRHFAARRPIVAHGLSFNLGGPAPLGEAFLCQVKSFLA